ncbi:MAG: beta-L-arabinofuranosidase domain-containing protein [Pirellulaceae bacterium]
MSFTWTASMGLSLVAALATGHPVDVQFAAHAAPVGHAQLQLRRAFDRLCSPPLDNVELVLADVSLEMNRRFDEYSGDISGRMLGALNAAGPLLGRQAPILGPLVARLPAYQKPDGHFGAEQDLPRLVQKRDMPILWGNGRLLLALAERCRDDPDPTLLASARKLGEYMVATRTYFGKEENFKRLHGRGGLNFATCYPSMIDGLVALGQATEDERFHEEARFIGHLALLDKEFHDRHSHGRLVAYRGMLDLDYATGTRDFLDAVQADCERVARDYLFPTGGVAEYFDRSYGRDEGCSEADWIRVNFLLWRATGRTAYLDMAEHALCNHMISMQFSNGGFGHYIFRELHDGEVRYPWGAVTHVGSDSYWCCAMHCTQLLADAVRWVIMKSDRDVLITWLAEARATVKIDGRPITISACKKSCAAWQVTVKVDEPAQTTLRLRVPGWASSIRVDGQPVRSTEGWAELSRRWQGTTTLNVTFPETIRLAGPYATAMKPNEPVRIFVGSDLFCLPDIAVDDDLLTPDGVPTVILAANKTTGGTIPVLVEGRQGKPQTTALVKFT